MHPAPCAPCAPCAKLSEHEREGHAWCECLSLEGLYRTDDGGHVEIVVPDPCKESTSVLLRPGGELLFSVKTCALYSVTDSKAGDEIARLDVTSQDLKFADGRIWTLEAKLPNSICRAVREDAMLLKALGGESQTLDFCSAPLRAMTDQEWLQALKACGVSDARVSRKALLVVAPSAGGKTTVLPSWAQAFGVSLSSCVLCDGAIFRDFHDQYRLICENGVANHGLWYHAWPAAKSVVQDAKKEVLRMAMAQQQELAVSDTGAELENLTSLIKELRSNGYEVSLLGIYADPESIMERGIAREITDGKRYNRSLKKIKSTFENFGAAIALVDGAFKILHNASGQEAKVVLEGQGFCGEALPKALQEALHELVKF